jgi:5-hydroxyisourate hydrolase-like protein (transthyretin family)
MAGRSYFGGRFLSHALPAVPAALAGLLLLVPSPDPAGAFHRLPPPDVERLPAPPEQVPARNPTPHATAAARVGDKLVVRVQLPAASGAAARRTLAVELLDANDRRIARRRLRVQVGDASSTHRFRFNAPREATGRITVRTSLGPRSEDVPLSRILLAKGHETTLSGSLDLFAGTQAALRCEVHGVESVTRTQPAPGAEVTVRLQGGSGRMRRVYEGKTDADGVAEARFRVPDLPAGKYRLEVTTRSLLGEEKLTRTVKVKTSPRVLLTSDKPLYQPGQTMHLRALALRAIDLRPAGNAALTLEVEDGRGNKVFKRPLRTSEHGIAHADFELADEVNEGDYRLRAVLGEYQAEKSVTVRRYVLPKFRATLKADKTFYLPRETVRGELQADYFFGKPVAGAKVKVVASTFDVAFKEFQVWEGKTDERGHVKFEVNLPRYFVGLPLRKGDALVRLEAKVTDTADHAEVVSRTWPVSAQAIRVSLIPEGGTLRPGLDNRVFVAALYPDGSPARCAVKVWDGGKAAGKPLAEAKTDAAGLAEFTCRPKAAKANQAIVVPDNQDNGNGNVETQDVTPGELNDGEAMNVLDFSAPLILVAEARDAKGGVGRATVRLGCEPDGENVVLRLDKAVYRGGEPLKVEVHSSAGMPTVYLDVIKDGQLMLTRWLDINDSKAAHRLDLPAALFGTLEVHAYQLLRTGEIIRDTRLVYVSPADGLRIKAEADKGEYKPGGEAVIRFEVMDARGTATPAALGVLVVDEAVYALQDLQPGLEKVYFTLQQELLKPRVQVVYKPAEDLGTIVRKPEVPPDRQQVARVLLASVRPPAPARWEVNPVVQRQKELYKRVARVGYALFQNALGRRPRVRGRRARSARGTTQAEAASRVRLREQSLRELVKAGWLKEAQLNDPLDKKLTVKRLKDLEKGFTADRLARAVTYRRMQELANVLQMFGGRRGRRGGRTARDGVTAKTLKAAAELGGLGDKGLRDGWGRTMRLVKRAAKTRVDFFGPPFNRFDLMSAGPDGKFGTADDVKYDFGHRDQLGVTWWQPEQGRRVRADFLRAEYGLADGNDDGEEDQDGRNMEEDDGAELAPSQGPRRGRGGRGSGRAKKAMRGGRGGGSFRRPSTGGSVGRGPRLARKDKSEVGEMGQEQDASKAEGAPARLREYFPETLFWQPALITDDRGRAELRVPLADSITTWRLTTSATSRTGLLGGATAPLKVFQDFFVDLDLPVALTQNDEVAFPVAVYNYLKESQKVKLELQPEPWFELVGADGPVRELDVLPEKVTSVRYRIKAKKVGRFALTVKANGSKLSDAVKRTIEVLPDGRRVEQVATDRLGAKVTEAFTIPENAVPDASRLWVKVYPSVFSQLLEGAEGMLRMPHGCFEQTSSAAYPNVLVADHLKKTRGGSPALLLKAEKYLNVGYQRLLTFERPGGGFSLYGNGPPSVWLSAYGLMEFSDMARVYPVDRAVIDRTRKWLLKQQSADGTWSARRGYDEVGLGSSKLILTSYVTWGLLESLPRPEGGKARVPAVLQKAIEYIRTEAPGQENLYVLALAANALAACDAKDDSTHAVLTRLLKKLDAGKKEKPEWKAAFYPSGGRSLTWARGGGLSVETTALAALAMLKSGQFPAAANQALTYLLKVKGGDGTWGSTQGTVLALKALVAAAAGSAHKGTATFTVWVNGKEAKTDTVTEKDADVMRQFDLKDHLKAGRNEVEIEVKGETALTYQVVARHFEPWGKRPEAEKPVLEINVAYDREKLSTKDLLKAKATLRYHGREQTAMVIVDLPVPPGFSVDRGDFAEMVASKKIDRFSVTARQVTLYLGAVKPGAEQVFEYALRPRYPIKAKTAAAVAYEYYTPANRAAARPAAIEVTDR